MSLSYFLEHLSMYVFVDAILSSIIIFFDIYE